MAVSGDVVARLAAKFAVMLPLLDERQRRVYLGSEARDLGRGGIAVVARASGVAEATVSAGVAECEAGAEPMPGRARRPGGGRKRREDEQPGLREALLGLAEAATRGDPVAEVTWCSQSLRELERELAARGFSCRKDAVARMLREAGYRLQAMSKVLEGAQHPDRDAQFRHVNARIAAFRAAGAPVVSADAKKKELIGPFGRPGRQWRPQGGPVRVRDHDFPDRELGMITPYGVYDIAANRGFVSVGCSHDTAAFAVAALRLWWQREGSLRYPRATRLLVTCDAGGSNSARCRLWKDQLAVLAAETGLVIEVCHFPPGTSKWNKIEHRLFCHVTRTWRARPLMTIDDAVAGIAATATGQGLKCTAVRDDAAYPGGIEVSDARMGYLEDRVLDRAAFHGEWNYAVLPAPRPAPEPEPGPQRPGRCPQAVLVHPALTGMDPGDLRELATALDVPFAARREQGLYALRGRGRVNAEGAGPARRIDVLDHVIALRLRDHLGLPAKVTGALLGIARSTAANATILTRQLLDEHRIPLPAAAPPHGTRLRTPGDLLEYATRAGIQITIPETPQPGPKRAKRKTPENTTHPT